MILLEEIEHEIAALKEALEIIDLRTGDKLRSDNIKAEIEKNIRQLSSMRVDAVMDLPVHPYEPEYKPEDELF